MKSSDNKYYGLGDISTGFNVVGNTPLDDRSVVRSVTNLTDNTLGDDKKYPGMSVSTLDGQMFVLTDNDEWKRVGSDIPTANSSTSGLLSSADWIRFNAAANGGTGTGVGSTEGLASEEWVINALKTAAYAQSNNAGAAAGLITKAQSEYIDFMRSATAQVVNTSNKIANITSHVTYVTASVDFTVQLPASPKTGYEYHIIIKSYTGGKVTLPTTNVVLCGCDDTKTLSVNEFFEINAIAIGDKYYIKTA